ncbi:substance-P receptor-like [Actinia tenebrosa]|uniref:Substance-P receptor-like n=1 Tax=Actinia tenebrosa TaxID=6105 RepID=A0A6P8GZ41_ACTTE|nr:substance-P receptor-like [Actinia tenebrosa]
MDFSKVSNDSVGIDEHRFSESNGTSSSNNSLTAVVMDPLAVALKLTSCSIIGTLSIIGNILVIFVVFRVARMKTTTFYLIVNMSFSDILFTLISMPPFMLAVLGHGLVFGGKAGTFICKFVNPSSFGLMASSVLTMTAIALDRFLAIKHPLQAMMGTRMLKGIIISIWAASLIVSLPLVFSYELKEEKNFYYCEEKWSSSDTDNNLASRVYTIVLFIIIYCVPFLSMAILYYSLAHHLWCKKIPNNFHPIQRYLIICRRRVVRMLVAVLFCFIVCWLPLQVVTFSAYFQEDIQISPNVIFAVEMLIRANGAINPFLYLIFSRTFRQAAIKAFRFCFKRHEFASSQNDNKRKASSFLTIVANNNRMGSLKAVKKQETPI